MKTPAQINEAIANAVSTLPTTTARVVLTALLDPAFEGLDKLADEVLRIEEVTMQDPCSYTYGHSRSECGRRSCPED
jgi:hypothetical protein